MTRMFKQLVESSRKTLSRIAVQAQADGVQRTSQVLSEPERKPDFEPLESRVLFSGIGTGFNKKSVRFIDAWGDGVLVKLIGAPATVKFDITLDGGAQNHADIQNITIYGRKNAPLPAAKTAGTVLDVFVTPRRLSLSDTYTVGKGTKGSYAVTKSNQIFTPGFVEIGSIYAGVKSTEDPTAAPMNLRGITMNGADFQNIDVNGNIGTGIKTPLGKHPKSLYGGISVDLGVTQFRGGLLNDPVQAVGFGDITVTGSVNDLILHGRTSTPSTNNLNGSISITGGVNDIDARYSNVLAPISIGTGGITGSAFFNDILANVNSAGPVGQFNANNVLADVSAVTPAGAWQSIAGLSLSGSLLGTVQAGSFGAVSVNGNFTGLLQAFGPATGSSELPTAIGSVVINSGTAFTGTIEAVAGNIGNIILSQASTPFSGHVTADAGNIGNITAGFFSNAAVSALGGTGAIGNITSNATTATVTSGIVNSVFLAGSGGIGNISSVASITNSQFEAVNGSIAFAGGVAGNVTVLQGGLSGDVFGGSTTTLATNIGNITANLNIEGTSVIASGTLGNITSVAGHIGGSSNTASFISAGAGIVVNLTGALTLNGVLAIQGGQPGPKSDVFVAGSIGNISALSDISGNVITATAGNIGSITSHEGRIAFDAVSATGNIGAIYANSQDATFAFDSAGNVLEPIPAHAGNAFTGYTLVPSASAIDHSSFTAGGTIGAVTARASAVGGYFPVTPGPVYVANRGIDYSDFTAGIGIVSVTAVSAGTVFHDTKATPNGSLNSAIYDSTFTVTGAGTGLGNVSAVSNGGPAIYFSTFHAKVGNIANVYGRSILGDGIYGANIAADIGNVGKVSGISLGGAGTGGGDGLEGVQISAGSAPGGTGTIAGIFGQSAYGNGIDHTRASSGTGGIGYIKGISTGGITPTHHNAANSGISESNFLSTGAVGPVTGISSGGDGIRHVNVGGGSIGDIYGATSGYGSGIRESNFYAANGIGNITGKATTIIGADGIYKSLFVADGNGQGTGAILNITGTTMGIGGYGILKSNFYSGAGMGNILGGAKGAFGASGIAHSNFNADDAQKFASSIGTGTGNAIYGYSKALYGTATGILDSNFTAGATIGNILGSSTAPGAGSYGISGSNFYANAGKSTETGGIGNIGTITGTANANGAASGIHAGIAHSKFIAGAGPSSKGYINTVSGTSNLNGPAGLSAYGIYASTFVAGSGDGKFLGNITGYAKAQGSQVETSEVDANGIAYGYFYAGTGVVGSSSGTILKITGTGKAESAFGTAYGYGLSGVVAVAGGTGTGNIGNIQGTGDAYGQTTSLAQGIAYSHFQAAVLAGGVGSVGTVTGNATATSQVTASAIGIQETGVWSGYANGGIGNVAGTANATSATATATGINGVAKTNQTPSYASAFPGNYTLKAGSGHVGGVGAIGSIIGTGNATSSTGPANAYGIKGANVGSGYLSGSIVYIGGTAKANSGAGAATSDGILTSTFKVGYGASGTGSIGSSGVLSIHSYSKAVSATGNATAYGLNGVTFVSSLIGNVYGKAVAKAGTSAAPSGAAVTAKAVGIYNSHIYADAVVGGTVAPDNGTGTIGSVKGIGEAYAYGLGATAKGYGISKSFIVAGDGDFGTGTINYVYGYGKAIATVNTSNTSTALADSYGIFKSSVLAGTGYNATGTIGVAGSFAVPPTAKAVYGKAFSNATAKGNTADTATANSTGIDVGIITAGGGGADSIGKIGYVAGHGKALATGGASGAFGTGIVATHVYAAVVTNGTGNAYAGTGTIGNITGYGYGYATGYTAASKGFGVETTKIYAGVASAPTGVAQSYATVGAHFDSIGTLKGTGLAYATAQTLKAAGVAAGTAYGILGDTEVAGSAKGLTANASLDPLQTDKIGSVLGYGTAGTIAKPITGYTATAKGYGIKSLTLRAGYANATAGSATAGIASIAPNVTTAGGVTAGIYGKGVATSTAPNIAIAAGVPGLETTYSKANGVYGLTANAGTAVSGGALATNAATGAYGKMGNIYGKALAFAYTSDGLKQGSYAYGVHGAIKVKLGYASNTGAGAGTATAGKGIAGNVTGYGKAYFSTTVKDVPATPVTTTSTSTAYGIKGLPAGPSHNTYIDVGGAYTNGTGTATGYSKAGVGSTIGNIYGKAYADSYASKTTGTATSTAIGIQNFGAFAGDAIAFVAGNAVGGIGTLGNITGHAIARSYGFTAITTSKGIDPSIFHAGYAFSGLGTPAATTAGFGTIGTGVGPAIYGYAYGLATGNGGLLTKSTVDGLLTVTAFAGIPSTATAGNTPAGNVGIAQGNIGVVKGRALDPGTKIDSAYGISGSTFQAGTSISGVYAYAQTNSALGSKGDSIFGSNFRANNVGPGGTQKAASTQAIGYVKAYVTPGTVAAGTFGVVNSVFETSGSIGNIVIHGSVFNSAGPINTGFFAGDILGAGYAVASTVGTSGASIGTFTATGFFAADLVASANAPVSTNFGVSASDTSAGAGGSIGTINITLPAAPGTTGSASYGIEAHTLGVVTWGGTVISPAASGTIVNDHHPIGNGVRVRLI